MNESLTHWRGEPVATLRALWQVPVFEAYARIGSTNDRAKELASQPANTFAVVVADEQTAGRGRRGAGWHSAPGSGLWMSVVLPGQPALHVPLLVGLAVAEAVGDVAPDVPVRVEWPNDLVVRGKKLGGILCEGVPGAVVAGIGLNLSAPEGGFPAAIAPRATVLDAEGAGSASAGRLAHAVMRGLRRYSSQPSTVLTPEVLARLTALDALAGRPVTSEEHGPGTARGIEADGALVLERPDRSRVRVLAGSVRPL